MECYQSDVFVYILEFLYHIMESTELVSVAVYTDCAHFESLPEHRYLD
jgi:hypothetical protein